MTHLFRSTIIEPGPITTGFAVKAKEVREDIDISSTDDQTKSLLTTYLQSYYHFYKTVSESPSDVAEAVKKALLLKKPHLRYQTNKKYRQQDIATKVADTTGDKIVKLLDTSEASTKTS